MEHFPKILRTKTSNNQTIIYIHINSFYRLFKNIFPATLISKFQNAKLNLAANTIEFEIALRSF